VEEAVKVVQERGAVVVVEYIRFQLVAGHSKSPSDESWNRPYFFFGGGGGDGCEDCLRVGTRGGGGGVG